MQELTLEQVNLPQTTSSSSGSLILSTQIDSNGNDDTLLPNAQQIQNKNDSNITSPTQLGLDQGAMHEVYISAIVSGGHAFLQVSGLGNILETASENINSLTMLR